MQQIGRYEVIEELGRGTAGAVYKAFDPTINRLVSLKVLLLPPSASRGSGGAVSANDPLREARMAGCLTHPNIVTIYDAVGDEPNKLYYIVIEYVEGKPLDRILSENPLPSLKEVFDWLRQTAEALDYAHQRQIIHRDLKPANILVTEKGQVKITDFGIARNTSLEATVSTMALAGTPSYMSPEQITGGKLDGRSDLFSLGIIFYEMLVGRRPFPGELATVMFKTVYEEIPPPSQLRPTIPPEVERVVMRCLAKDARQRYATAGDFLNDLNQVAKTLGVVHATGEGAAISHAGEQERRPADAVAPAVASAPSAHRPTRWIYAVAAAAVAVAALAAIAYHRLNPLLAPVSPPPPVEATAAPPLRVWNPAPHPVPPPHVVPAKHPETPRSVSPTTGSPAHPLSTSLSQARKSSAPRVQGATSIAAPSQTPMAQNATQVRLVCRFPFAKGTLKLSSDGQVLFTHELIGRKKRRILFIGGGYVGRLSKLISIPSGLRRITARVIPLHGAKVFSATLPVKIAPRSEPTLQLIVDGGRLRAQWINTSAPSH